MYLFEAAVEYHRVSRTIFHRRLEEGREERQASFALFIKDGQLEVEDEKRRYFQQLFLPFTVI